MDDYLDVIAMLERVSEQQPYDLHAQVDRAAEAWIAADRNNDDEAKRRIINIFTTGNDKRVLVRFPEVGGTTVRGWVEPCDAAMFGYPDHPPVIRAHTAIGILEVEALWSEEILEAIRSMLQNLNHETTGRGTYYSDLMLRIFKIHSTNLMLGLMTPEDIGDGSLSEYDED